KYPHPQRICTPGEIAADVAEAGDAKRLVAQFKDWSFGAAPLVPDLHPGEFRESTGKAQHHCQQVFGNIRPTDTGVIGDGNFAIDQRRCQQSIDTDTEGMNPAQVRGAGEGYLVIAAPANY